mgnify:CR=1 FL=1
MQLVLQGLLWKDAIAYLDDVIALGTDLDSHIESLRRVLGRFREHNLKLKPQKCQLFQWKVEFLGKVVSPEGIAMDP